MSILTAVHDMVFGKPEQSRRYFQFGKRPVTGSTNQTDMTGGFAADTKQLDAIYHGEDNAYNLAAGLIYTPIARPVQLVGNPTPVSEDKATQDALNLITAQFSDEFSVIELAKQLHGTAWRWARWDNKNNNLCWEMIPDDSVTMIEQDIISGEITGIYTDDQFTVANGPNTTQIVQRKRHITRQRIDVQWTGNTAGMQLQDTSQYNRYGILPRPFGHDTPQGKWRGYSVIGRTLRLVKAYHDVNRTVCELLSDFVPKWVQYTGNGKDWFYNNGFSEENGVMEATKASFSDRFVLNIGDKEKTEFLYLPSNATTQYDARLDKIRQECIAASPVPEIFYGNLATGNEASVGIHKDMAITYIDSLRQENVAPYDDLFTDSLILTGAVDGHTYGTVHTTYDALDMMSAEERSTVFKNVAQGVQFLVSSCGGTLDDMYFFWKRFYPTLPENDVKKFIAALPAMQEHHARSSADPALLSDLNNATPAT
jgi:hypothetical protein